MPVAVFFVLLMAFAVAAGHDAKGQEQAGSQHRPEVCLHTRKRDIRSAECNRFIGLLFGSVGACLETATGSVE